MSLKKGFIVGCVAGVCCLAAWGAWRVVSSRPLTDLVDVWNWNAKNGRPRPVRVQAIVTYVDPAWRMMNVQQGTTGWFVDPEGQPKDLVPGALVEISGTSDPAVGISTLAVRKLGVSELPQPLLTTVSGIAKGANPGVVVKATGIVRSFRMIDSRPTLRLGSGQSAVNVRVLEGDAEFLRSLVNSVIMVTGVESPPIDATRPIGEVFVSSVKSIQVLDRGTSDLLSLAVTPLEQLENPTESAHAVRIRQPLLSRGADNVWLLGTQQNPVRVRTVERIVASQGDLLDVVGFPVAEPNGITLSDAVVTQGGTFGRQNRSTLTNIRQVTSLSREEASAALPVNLTATVTFFDPLWQVLFVEDATGGVYVENVSPSLKAQHGDLVQIEARTAPGGFAPDITDAKITLLRPSVLPEPANPTIEDILTGRYDSQRIRVLGVVRSAVIREQQRRLFIDLVSSNTLVQIQVLEPKNIGTLDRLVDSKVEFTGVATTSVNPSMQMIGTTLLVARLEDMKVTEWGPADPFEEPDRDINSLLRFAAPGRFQHRVHVNGVVVAQHEQTVYLRDQSGSVAVKLQDAQEFPTGSVVDVVGFVAPGETKPELVNAIGVVRGKVRLPATPVVAVDDLLEGRFDADLVAVEGTVLSSAQLPNSLEILLQSNGRAFNAALPVPSAAAQTTHIQAGSFVRVKGILQLQLSGSRSAQTPTSFKIQLRNREDLVVLDTPPWWNFRDVAIAMGILLSIAGAALLWVFLLKRQVRQQTVLIRRQTAGLMRSEKLAGLGQLVAGVAHELNNPLTAIIGYSDLLLDDMQDESQRQKTHRVGTEARRMKRIIENLLNFSRPKSAHRRPISIEMTVRRALALCESTLRNQNIEFELNFAQNLPELELDDDQLQRVFLNLFSNSTHALESVSFRKILVEGRLEDGAVIVRFSDSGHGFPDVHRAFEPFYTTKPVGQGTGLGLSICYGLVKENGGEIHVENLQPAGALVILRFPVQHRLRPGHRRVRIKDRIASHVLFQRASKSGSTVELEP